MATVNGSYVSPTADATIFPKVFQPSGLVTSLLQDFTLWKTLVTLFLAAVVYDQCMSYRVPSTLSPIFFFFFLTSGLPVCAHNAWAVALHDSALTNQYSNCFSTILLSEGSYYWPDYENSFHGPLSSIGQPQIPRVQGEMGQW